MFLLIRAALQFPKGYIAHPYWPAREKLINIQKISGVNRVRTEEKRAAALKAYLDKNGLTMDDYKKLEIDASRPFYTVNGGDIVIPANQLHGAMAQAAAICPSTVRLAKAEQVRSVMEWRDLATGKHGPDGVWERFVPVKSGTGQTLSNQRGLRSDPYIEAFTACGTLSIVNPEMEKRAREFIAWTGLEVGVGAARKMGWGRFTIVEWEAAK